MTGTTSDHTEPLHHQKWAADNAGYSQYDSFNIGVAEFSRLYTTGELTLCQAVNGIRAYISNVAQYSVDQCTIARTLRFLGHRLTEQDEYAVEMGWSGDVDAWIAGGNLPQGWYSLFKDNYPSYCREMTRKNDERQNEGSNPGNDSPDGRLPLVDE